MVDGQMPVVSVLLPVHNGERHVEAALRSIMDQTLREIEIVVVDDASTDTTPQILKRLAAEDPRIRVVTVTDNLKLPGALNLGLDHVRAPLVARMDDDDVALPDRLAVQMRFLDAHPDITLVGSSIEWIDGDGTPQRRSIRSRDTAAIRWGLRFFLQVSHPTMMFRTALPDGTALRYDPAWTITEDHDLAVRLVMAGAHMACLPDVLLQYRAHEGSVSRQKLAEQMRQAHRIGRRLQDHDLPADMVAAIAPLRECYFDFAAATPDRTRGCFAGALAMLAHDIAARPDRRTWLRRQTAQLLDWALRRGGASSGAVLGGFVRHAPGLLPALGLRLLETKGRLPARFHSDTLAPSG